MHQLQSCTRAFCIPHCYDNHTARVRNGVVGSIRAVAVFPPETLSVGAHDRHRFPRGDVLCGEGETPSRLYDTQSFECPGGTGNS